MSRYQARNCVHVRGDPRRWRRRGGGGGGEKREEVGVVDRSHQKLMHWRGGVGGARGGGGGRGGVHSVGGSHASVRALSSPPASLSFEAMQRSAALGRLMTVCAAAASPAAPAPEAEAQKNDNGDSATTEQGLGMGRPDTTSSSSMLDATATSVKATDEPRKAAFFDVDGTVAKSNVVLPYYLMRLEQQIERTPRWWRVGYTLIFLLRSIVYLIADAVSRTAFSRLFYWSYRGEDAARAEDFLATRAWEKYMRPNLFPAALAEIARLKARGFMVVLVTGSLECVVRPLATLVGADHVIAASLEAREEDGRRVYTGNLSEQPLAGREKAVQVRRLAEEANLDLEGSVAYGDSKADVDMLRCVGEGNAVRPDRTMLRIAREEGWAVHEWPLPETAVSAMDVFMCAVND